MYRIVISTPNCPKDLLMKLKIWREWALSLYISILTKPFYSVKIGRLRSSCPLSYFVKLDFREL